MEYVESFHQKTKCFIFEKINFWYLRLKHSDSKIYLKLVMPFDYILLSRQNFLHSL